MKKENWKDIYGYENIYQVSDLGNIRRVNKLRRNEGNDDFKVLRQRLHSKGCYYQINLSRNGKSKTFIVHRLVALAFLGDPEEGQEVNHINGNGLDNRLENIEWVSRSVNVNHALEHDLNESSNKIILEDEEGNLLKFDSMVKASLYLGKSGNYISNLTREGVFVVDNYNIYVFYRSK